MRVRVVVLFILCAVFAHAQLPQNPAVDKINITGNVNNVFWSQDLSAALLETDSGFLYLSIDSGITWNLYFNESATYTVVQSPVDNNAIMILSEGQGYWATPNFPSSAPIFYPNEPTSIRMHYLNPFWVVGVFSGTVAYSTNLGASWNDYIAPDLPVAYAYWGCANSNVPELLTFAVLTDNTLVTSIDGGLVWVYQVNNSPIIGMFVTPNHVFVGAVVDGVPGISLFAMNTYMSSVILEPVQYPPGVTLPPLTSMALLDDTEGPAWVAINTAPQQAALYTSRTFGIQFTETINDLHQGAWYDFEKSKDVSGIYMVNVVPEQGTLKTMITYSNGGFWQTLQAPSVDFNGDPIECVPPCSLNLAGLTSYFTKGVPPMYTSPQSVGVVMAVGNVGNYLQDDADSMQTYLSRDNGLTWKQISQNVNIYEIGNHGGILVMALTEPTMSIQYSFDEGLSWFEYQFEEQPVRVVNIISEPQGRLQNFLLLGESNQNTPATYVINFQGLVPNECQPADYELYTPTDGLENQTCILGQIVAYQRKIQSHECYNNVAKEAVFTITQCPCTYMDYECGEDFVLNYRAEDGSGYFNCTSLVDQPWYPIPSPCVPGTVYALAPTYRLIPSTNCNLGDPASVNLVTYTCPSSPTATPIPTKKQPGKPSHGGLVAGIIIGLLLAVVLAVFVAYKFVPGFRGAVNTRIRGWRGSEYQSITDAHL